MAMLVDPLDPLDISTMCWAMGTEGRKMELIGKVDCNLAEE